MVLPTQLYRSQQVKQGELKAAQAAGINLYSLMLSAGEAVFHLITEQYSQNVALLVICGGGNNGGDGYVVAKLALKQGMAVTVWATKSPLQLNGDALLAYHAFIDAGGKTEAIISRR